MTDRMTRDMMDQAENDGDKEAFRDFRETLKICVAMSPSLTVTLLQKAAGAMMRSNMNGESSVFVVSIEDRDDAFSASITTVADDTVGKFIEIVNAYQDDDKADGGITREMILAGLLKRTNPNT